MSSAVKIGTANECLRRILRHNIKHAFRTIKRHFGHNLDNADSEDVQTRSEDEKVKKISKAVISKKQDRNHEMSKNGEDNFVYNRGASIKINPQSNRQSTRSNLEGELAKKGMMFSSEKNPRAEILNVPQALNKLVNPNAKGFEVANDQNVIKIGDIIYLKLNTQVLFQNAESANLTQKKWNGFMVGDGLSSERLVSVREQDIEKLSVNNFLFRIELGKKYHNRGEFNEKLKFFSGSNNGSQSQKELTLLHEKYLAEEREYQSLNQMSLGLPVTYGQNIIFRHLASKCYLTLNSNELARQIGSIKVQLNQKDNYFSNMKFLPSSRVRRIGDVVNYSDSVNIVNSMQHHYFIHASEFITSQEAGVEINGSEIKTEWKPKLYKSFDDLYERGEASPIVVTGDVVCFYSRHFNGYLSVTSHDIQAAFEVDHTFVTKGGVAEVALNKIPMSLRVINRKKKMNYQTKFEPHQEPSFFSYWEIQNLRIFDSALPKYYKVVRIKNVATQQYLARSKSDSSEHGLVLTPDGSLNECLFYFSTKSAVSKEGYISSEDLVRIKDLEENCITIKLNSSIYSKPKNWDLKNMTIENEVDEKSFEIIATKKSQPAVSIFEVKKCTLSKIEVSQKLSSLFNSFLNFHFYLQDWGQKKNEKTLVDKEDKKTRQFREFNYNLSIDNEKELEAEVEILDQSLKNLKNFLTLQAFEQDSAATQAQSSVELSLRDKGEISYEEKQNLLLEQGTIEILLNIAKLVEFLCYNSLRCIKTENDNEDENSSTNYLVSYQTLKANDFSKLERLPQTIARKQLKKVIDKIIEILFLACRRNSYCSSYLMKHYTFLLDLVNFFPDDMMMLLEELVRNQSIIQNEDTSSLTVLQQHEIPLGKSSSNTPKSFEKHLLEMVEELNENTDNINRQIQLLNLFCCLVTDDDRKFPVKTYQNSIKQIFFYEMKEYTIRFEFPANLEDDRFDKVNFNQLTAIFCLKSNANVNQFLDNNPKLLHYKDQSNSNEIAVRLQDMCEAEQEVYSYIEFISSYVNLLADLCKGKNEENIAFMQKPKGQVRLTKHLCEYVLFKTKVSSILKSAFLEYYMATEIDISPMEKLTLNQNRCFEYDSILQRKISEEPIVWLNSKSNQQRVSEMIADKSVENINTFISNLIELAFRKIPDDIWIGRMQGDNRKRFMTVESESTLEAISQALKFQALTVEVVNQYLDFGYADSSMVVKCIGLTGLILTSESSEDTSNTSSFHQILRVAKNKIEITPIYRTLVLRSLQTLKIIGHLRIQLQLLVLLKYFTKFETCKKEVQDNMPNIFKIYSLFSTDSAQRKHTPQLNLEEFLESIQPNILEQLTHKFNPQLKREQGEFREDAEENSSFFNEIQKEIQSLNSNKIPIDYQLFLGLISLDHSARNIQSVSIQNLDVVQVGNIIDNSVLNTSIKKEILSVIVGFYNQQHTLLEELMKVELIHGHQEMALFNSLLKFQKIDLELENNILKNQDTLSLYQISVKIEEILQFEKNTNQVKKARSEQIFKEVLEQIHVVQSVILLINQKLRQTLQKKTNFIKLQNLLRNLGYHHQFLRLFSLGANDLLDPLFHSLVDFFTLFTIQNPTNQRDLKVFIPHFIDLVNLPTTSIDTSELLRNLSFTVVKPSEITDIISYIFKKIGEIIDSGDLEQVFAIKKNRAFLLDNKIRRGLEKLCCYKKMLSGIVSSSNEGIRGLSSGNQTSDSAEASYQTSSQSQSTRDDGKRKICQRMIISNLINTKDLVKIFDYRYFCEVRSILTSQNQSGNQMQILLDFYCSYITLLAELSQDFNFGVIQARRLLTLEQLVDILTSNSTPFIMKKHFLKCFHHVFMDSLSVGLRGNENLIEEIMNLVISHDLSMFSVYIDHVIATKSTSKEELTNQRQEILNMRLQKNQRVGKKKEGNLNKMAVQNDEEVIVGNKNEYWKYLMSHEDYEESSYGLLYFAHSFIKKFAKNEFQVSREFFANTFMDIKNHLTDLLESLREVENIIVRANLTKECSVICECLLIIPSSKVFKIGRNMKVIDGENAGNQNDLGRRTGMEESEAEEEDGQEEDDANTNEYASKSRRDILSFGDMQSKSDLKLVELIRAFLLVNRIDYETFANKILFKNTNSYVTLIATILDQNEEQTVLKEINMILKSDDKMLDELESNQVTLNHVARVLVGLERLVISYKIKDSIFKLKPCLKDLDHNLGGGMANKQPRDSTSLKTSYQIFIQEYMSSNLEDGKFDKELDDWVTKLMEFLRADAQMNPKDILFSYLSTCIKSGDLFFLLRTLKRLLESLYDNKPKLKQMQNLLDDADVPLLCLSLINNKQDEIIVNQATQVIIDMLLDGNIRIQQKIFLIFEQNIYTKELFSYLKDLLKITGSKLKSELKNPIKKASLIDLSEQALICRFTGEDSFKQIFNILDMLKKMCDGCYQPFQNYLRVQHTRNQRDNPYSINLITEVSDFLVGLVLDNKKQIITEDRISDLLLNCLDLLQEATIGPCFQNQEILIKNKRLLEVVNELLRIDLVDLNSVVLFKQKELNLDSNRVNILTEIIKFLSGLVSGNRDQAILEQLIENIDREKVVQKLVQIFFFKIKDYQDDLLVGNTRKFEKKLTNLSDDDFKQIIEDDKLVVDSGFNLFLVVEQLKDVLGEDRRLDIFKPKNVNENAYNELQDRIISSFKKKGAKDLDNFEMRIFLQNEANLSRDYHGKSNPSQKLRDSSKKVMTMISSFNMNITPADQLQGEHDMNDEIVNNRYLRANQKAYGRENASWMRSIPYTQNIDELQGLKFAKNSVMPIGNAQGKKDNTPQKSKDSSEVDENEIQMFLEMQRERYFNMAFKFFTSFTATVEVVRNNELEVVHFRIPFHCKYISQNIKDSIIWKSNRESDQERLESFVTKIDGYDVEMKTRQRLSKARLMYVFIQEWRTLGNILSWIVFAVNIILLISLEHEYSEASEGSVTVSFFPELKDGENSLFIKIFFEDARKLIFGILNWLHLILTAIVFVFGAIERYPKSVYNSASKVNKLSDSIKAKEIRKRYTKFYVSGNLDNYYDQISMKLGKKVSLLTGSDKNSDDDGIDAQNHPKADGQNPTAKVSFFSKLTRVVLDFENIYRGGYMVITVMAFLYPLFYGFLLLDILKSSGPLQNVVRSVTKNAGLLFKTALLGMYVIYLYAVFAYSYFPSDYQHGETDDWKSYCHTLRHCFVSTLTNGMRAGGGIGEAIGPVTLENPNWLRRLIFDYSFYLIVMVILLNMISGIIIDAFGDLRDERNNLEEDIRGKCYICGMKKFILDTKGEGWYTHIYKNHSVYNYLFFYIAMKEKNILDCNGVEKYIKEKLEYAADISWVPQGRSININEIDTRKN